MKAPAKGRRKVVRYIFRATITINGVKYFARDYGLKGFPIPVYR